jgi:hypothetical protein
VSDLGNEYRQDLMGRDDRHGGSGIVVLSASMQLLHMNRLAMQLANHLGSAEFERKEPTDPKRFLAPPLIKLASQILAAFDYPGTQEKGGIESHSWTSNSGQPVLIRGFGLRGLNGIGRARIVLILTETNANHPEIHQSPGSVL